jgi:hypothetical protein
MQKVYVESITQEAKKANHLRQKADINSPHKKNSSSNSQRMLPSAGIGTFQIQKAEQTHSSTMEKFRGHQGYRTNFILAQSPLVSAFYMNATMLSA